MCRRGNHYQGQRRLCGDPGRWLWRAKDHPGALLGLRVPLSLAFLTSLSVPHPQDFAAHLSAGGASFALLKRVYAVASAAAASQECAGQPPFMVKAINEPTLKRKQGDKQQYTVTLTPVLHMAASPDTETVCESSCARHRLLENSAVLLLAAAGAATRCYSTVQDC